MVKSVLTACSALCALCVVAAEAPSRGRFETPVAADMVSGPDAAGILAASLATAGRSPSAPNGYVFGASEQAGERSTVLEFADSIPLGALYSSNPKLSFSWRDSATGEWRKMRRLDDEGRSGRAHV